MNYRAADPTEAQQAAQQPTEELELAPPPIAYDIEIRSGGRIYVVSWGDSPGWIRSLASELEAATEITLAPKLGHADRLPKIRQPLEPGQKWILYSRVTGTITDGEIVAYKRIYALGYEAAGRRVIQTVDHTTGVKDLEASEA